MNASAKQFVVREHIEGIVSNVFNTMLNLKATPATAGLLRSERVSGVIGIGGEHASATVYVHLPEALARDITRSLLQSIDGQSIGDNEVNDVAGELSNMIGGTLKSKLNDADIFCAMSTPSVIRGAFAVEAPPGVRAEMFYFNCLGKRFAVEVHLQLN